MYQNRVSRWVKVQFPDSPKPTVIISECLMGMPVRYDGGHKFIGESLAFLSNHLNVQGFCPEVQAGLGVPRPPIQLQINAEGYSRAVRVDGEAADVHSPLNKICTLKVQQLPCPTAAILKARSPSCGHGDTPLFNHNGSRLGETNGLFTAALRRRFADIPLINEEDLLQPLAAEWLVIGCYLAAADKPLTAELAEAFFWEKDLNAFMTVAAAAREKALQQLSEK